MLFYIEVSKKLSRVYREHARYYSEMNAITRAKNHDLPGDAQIYYPPRVCVSVYVCMYVWSLFLSITIKICIPLCVTRRARAIKCTIRVSAWDPQLRAGWR